jgi:hypothetical protein
MPNEKPTNDRPHDDALAALHGLGKADSAAGTPAPEETAEDAAYEVQETIELAEETEPGPSASGFVGMLSKAPMPQDDPSPTRPVNPSQSSRPTPQPSSEAHAAPASPRAAGTDEIRMAREITRPAAVSPARPGSRPGARGRKIPGWYHVAVPIMFTVSSLLMIIGFWAVGAIIAIIAGFDGYPLLSHAVDSGGYPITDDAGHPLLSSMSKVMAFTMLIALPVAISLVVMAIIMQRQVSKAARKS